MHTVLDTLANSRTAKTLDSILQASRYHASICQVERSDDGQLYLYAVRQMFPYFHAAGHLSYANYANIYLQQMSKLHSLLSSLLYQRFPVDGCFTVRRSEKYWCGNWS